MNGLKSKIVLDEIGSLNDSKQPYFGVMAIAYSSEEHLKNILSNASESGILDIGKRIRGKNEFVFDKLTDLLCKKSKGCFSIPSIAYVRTNDAGVNEWTKMFPIRYEEKYGTGAPKIKPYLWSKLVTWAFATMIVQIAIYGNVLLTADLLHDSIGVNPKYLSMIDMFLERNLTPSRLKEILPNSSPEFQNLANKTIMRYKAKRVTIRGGDDKIDKEIQLSHLLGRMFLQGRKQNIDKLKNVYGPEIETDLTKHFQKDALSRI